MVLARSQPKQNLSLTTAAAALPVSLNEVRAHMQIDDTDVVEDPNLMAMLRAATLACERFIRRSLVNTTWTLWMDRFPGKTLPWWNGVRQIADTELVDLTEPIILPRPPLSSVTHVKAHKQDGTTTTVNANNYFVDTASEPGRIMLKVGQSWPIDALRIANAVEVEFVAGYGPVGSDVPAPIRQAILISVADLAGNREGSPAKFEKVGDSSISRFGPDDITVPARHLLSSYKDWHV